MIFLLPNFVEQFHFQIICVTHSCFSETYLPRIPGRQIQFSLYPGLNESRFGTLGARYSAPLDSVYSNSTYLKHSLEHKVRFLAQCLVHTECLVYIRQCY